MAADDNVVRSNNDLNKYFGQNKTESAEPVIGPDGEKHYPDGPVKNQGSSEFSFGREEDYIPIEGSDEKKRELSPEEAKKYRERLERAKNLFGDKDRNDKYKTFSALYSDPFSAMDDSEYDETELEGINLSISVSISPAVLIGAVLSLGLIAAYKLGKRKR